MLKTSECAAWSFNPRLELTSPDQLITNRPKTRLQSMTESKTDLDRSREICYQYSNELWKYHSWHSDKPNMGGIK